MRSMTDEVLVFAIRGSIEQRFYNNHQTLIRLLRTHLLPSGRRITRTMVFSLH